MSTWPHRTLGYRATAKQAQSLAAELVDLFGSDPEDWLEPGRFETKDEPGINGGLEALCIPMPNDSFRFAIFGHEDSQEREFLILHEIAHTFFYLRADNAQPRRAMIGSPALGNDWEESFCDSFALAVTGLSKIPSGLSKRADREAVS